MPVGARAARRTAFPPAAYVTAAPPGTGDVRAAGGWSVPLQVVVFLRVFLGLHICASLPDAFPRALPAPLPVPLPAPLPAPGRPGH